ncbi:MAG: N-6 DNA methylase [Ignavibacteriales bacterium]|nr:N-6 DNA methylase [Ignavibacteriales bacterium]
MNNAENISELSLYKLSDTLFSKTNNILRTAKTEEDLRIGFEKILDPIKEQLKITYSNPKYEKSVGTGFSDAMHGQVIIEYEPPNSFKYERNINHAYEQLIGYMTDELKTIDNKRLIGVGFDGIQIFFVQYNEKTIKKIEKSKFILQGPYNFNTESAKTFLIYLRSLSRFPLNADNLANKFGPKSKIAQETITAFINALNNWGDETHKNTYFNEWKRLFGIVYGEKFSDTTQKKELTALSNEYNLSNNIDFQKLLFCVHTYFALIMKLIAAEILTLKVTSFNTTLSNQFTHATSDELLKLLEDIENGGIYSRRGIRNFLEGDFFRWYLYAFDSPELQDSIKNITRCLSEFEPATTTIDPFATRDLLKKLYQYLIPKDVRHKLGEYYTPDWLAELLIKEVGYNGNTLKRFLDPACGSGTFLVIAIQKAKEHGQKENLPPLEIAKRIVANIWGFDLNPLAVIASRTNYIFALGDMINKLENIEIPIYLTDSVLTPTRTSTGILGESLDINTSVGEFKIPKEWINNQGLLLSYAVPIIEEMTTNQYSYEDAKNRMKKEGLIFNSNENIVSTFYNKILKLEQENKNGIWARFLKNAFAPMMAGKFDFVVGNPPWILWEYLSQEYRGATQSLWENYGLTRIGKTRNVLIRGRRDFSMLFTYASADYYLKEKAKLGFLITQEVFKSKGAGEGFRRFQFGEGKFVKIIKAHDLVSIQPFEGATNKTAAIILKKEEKTEYPLPYFIWTKKKGVGKISTDKLLNEVLPLLQKKKYYAKPIGSNIGAWRTQDIEAETTSIIEGKNFYKAHRGTAIDPYGIFWLKIVQIKSNNTILINNLVKHSRKNIPQKEAIIENDLVYPGIRGSDIARWQAEFQIYTLITHPGSQQPYNEAIMKNKWPRTFSYLTQFKEILMDRGVYKHFHEKANNPFYGQRDFGNYTFSNYKVVWKRMSNDIFAAVVSEFKTLYGYKKAIPLDTTSFFAISNEIEAHYLCAIINSNPFRNFIKSFSSAGRGFGTPSVMEHVGIPKFDKNNNIHQQLAENSKQCHDLKLKNKNDEILKLEEENNKLALKLLDKK